MSASCPHILAILLQEKAQYRDGFESLRELKTEIEHRQQIAAQGQARVRADFARWLAVMRRQAGLSPPDEAELRAAAFPPNPAGRTAGRLEKVGRRPVSAFAAGNSGIEDEPSQAVAASGDAAGLLRHTTGSKAVLTAVSAGEAAVREPRASSNAQMVDDGHNFMSAQLRQDVRVQPASDGRHRAAVSDADDRDVKSSAPLAGAESGVAHAPHLRQDQDDDPFAGVDPEVLAAAKPMLTGNMAADKDIIRFYEARTKLLRSQTLAPWRTL